MKVANLRCVWERKFSIKSLLLNFFVVLLRNFSGMVLKHINNINVMPQMYKHIPFPFSTPKNSDPSVTKTVSTQHDISWNSLPEDETNLWKFQQNNKNFSIINFYASYLFLWLSFPFTDLKFGSYLIKFPSTKCFCSHFSHFLPHPWSVGSQKEHSKTFSHYHRF